MIEQLFELLKRDVGGGKGKEVEELEERLRASASKAKEIEERYQSTKRYVEILRSECQEEIRESRERYEGELREAREKLQQYEMARNQEKSGEIDEINDLKLINQQLVERNKILEQ